MSSVRLLALGAWGGILLGVGMAAAVLFPTVKETGALLPSATGVGEGWLLIAGRVGQRLFAAGNVAQVVAAGVWGLLAVPSFAGRRASRMESLVRTRVVLGLLAAGLVAYQLAWLHPRMNEQLEAYWSACQAGDAVLAEMGQSGFRELHPLATRVMGGTIVVVVALFLAEAWALGRGERRGGRAA